MEACAVTNRPQHSTRITQKKKGPHHSGDIVFSRGYSIQTVPSLSKQVKGITECVIGLQYIWEYRSPSKSVPPHYQCKLCFISRLQHDIIAHIKGWKHCFRYIKKNHPDKLTCDEQEAIKDPAIRKAIKAAAAEVEQTDGRGQVKVLLKEPSEVAAFRALRSAVPYPVQPHGPMHMGPPFNPRFSRPFPPRDDAFFNGPLDEYSEEDFGGFPAMPDFLDSGINQRPFRGGTGGGHPPMSGPDGHLSQQHAESPGKMYPDKFQPGQVDGPPNRPHKRGLLGAAPRTSSNTLLLHLDNFQIENENDAQMVLKVTQKLTDKLIEYRLKSVSKPSSLDNISMSNNSSTPPLSRFPGGTHRFSDPSAYPTGPSRFFS